MSATIVNPLTPFVYTVPGTFLPGQAVSIRGVAAPNGDKFMRNIFGNFYYHRFDINFQTRETTFVTDDIAFHISVRLLQGYIARNSFRDGGWEEEEGYGDLPIEPGQQFELSVLCEQTQFKVTINGIHFCDFKHRSGCAEISHFGVNGDVTLNLVAFKDGAPPPSYQQLTCGGQSEQETYSLESPYKQPEITNEITAAEFHVDPPSYAQAVNMPRVNQTPFVCPVPGSFFPGQMVRIRGVAAPNGGHIFQSFYYHRFDINFQTKESTLVTDDIVFHISVRLLQGYIARNSFFDGEWKEEEGCGDLPIEPGEHFELLVLCEPTQFKVAINGRHYCDFKHRLGFAKISHFGVAGDVALNLVAFEDGAAPPSYQQSIDGGQPQLGMYSAGYPYEQDSLKMKWHYRFFKRLRRIFKLLMCRHCLLSKDKE